jgi:hypothetical protein
MHFPAKTRADLFIRFGERGYTTVFLLDESMGGGDSDVLLRAMRKQLPPAKGGSALGLSALPDE